MRTLREDQSGTMDTLRNDLRSHKRICIQAPTGYGKTVFAAELVDRVRRKDKKLIFTVPAIALVDQTVAMFYEQGIMDVGVIQAHHSMTDWSQPIQICSIQTLMKKEVLPKADIVLADECHRLFTFQSHWYNMDEWLNIPFVGLSATPWTKGLGMLYQHLIVAGTTQGLIDAGLSVGLSAVCVQSIQT